MALFRNKRRDPVEDDLRDDDVTSDDLYAYHETLSEITAGLPSENGESEYPSEKDLQEEAVENLRNERRRRRSQERAEREDEIRAAEKKNRRSQTIVHHDDEEEDLPTAAPRGPKAVIITIVTMILSVSLLMLVINRSGFIGDKNPLLEKPVTIAADTVTPIQQFFSQLTESVAGFFRTLKRRAALETEYQKLLEENERLIYENMLMNEQRKQLSQFADLNDEMNANRAMLPVACQVIGRNADSSSYFNTLVINRGSRDGIEEYMAVTYNGSLIGYTESVTETKSNVRCIIDSTASIAALIESSRDQGTVRGTLGIDGKPMCRMYYLPDNSLPRPGDTVVTSGVGMSFPKGIPIGTVRESTRGMEANKSYIVVEPFADFEHIEYVIVLRYQPAALAVEGRENTSAYLEFVPLDTVRPVPELQLGSVEVWGATPAPTATTTPAADVTPSPAPTETPVPTPSPTPPGPTEEVIDYHSISQPTPTPAPETPTPSPSPTPYITLLPEDLIYEDD